MIGVLKAAWLIARKDIRVEVRSRELAYTTLFFAIACVMIFAFALIRDEQTSRAAVDNPAAGVLWVVIAFAGTLALGRTFERERQSETLRALLLSPIERPAIYLGKLVSLLMLLTGIELLLLPVVALWFHAKMLHAPGLLLGLVVAGTVGFAAVGTLFAAMLVRAQSRDVLLPIVLYPITVPVILAGAQGTAVVFSGSSDLSSAQLWLTMLVFFDIVFITLALWTFAPVMSD